MLEWKSHGWVYVWLGVFVFAGTRTALLQPLFCEEKRELQAIGDG